MSNKLDVARATTILMVSNRISIFTLILRPLKAWFEPNVHNIYPKVITLRNSVGKLSNLAKVDFKCKLFRSRDQ